MRINLWPLAIIRYTDDLPEKYGGLARAFYIKIRPKYIEDIGLLKHELVHVSQYWRSSGLSMVWARFDKMHMLDLEVEAYKEQLKYYPDDKTDLFAEFLSTKYDFNISKDEAKMRLAS